MPVCASHVSSVSSVRECDSLPLTSVWHGTRCVGQVWLGRGRLAEGHEAAQVAQLYYIEIRCGPRERRGGQESVSIIRIGPLAWRGLCWRDGAVTRFHSTTTLVQSRAPVSALPTAQVRLETRQAHVRDHRRRVEGVCRAATRGDSGGPHNRGARIAIATLSCEVDLAAARVWASPLRASDALADRDRAGRGARVGEEEEERGRAAGSGEVREYGYGGSQRAGLEARVARAQGIQGATPACPRRDKLRA